MPDGYIERLLVRLDSRTGQETEERKPLAAYEHARGIVLLGDPGIGKTEELRQAAARHGSQFLTATRFVHRNNLGSLPSRLIIDALDESRGSGATVDTLLAKLEDAGCPAFLLSCRVADWYGGSDLQKIIDVYGSENIVVLRLLGLSRSQAEQLLDGKVPSTAEFVREAERRDLGAWLENPNDVLLLAKTASSGWPSTRVELFEKSSRVLARERDVGRAQREPQVSDDVLLDTAGAVCAGLLISGTSGVRPNATNKADTSLAALSDFDAEPSLVARIVRSNLFAAEGADFVRPRHKTTADFLAARWLSRCIEKGAISLRRLVALIAPDGKPPTELRGVFAWLVTSVKNEDAAELLSVDPFGLLLYGDAGVFDTSRLDMLLTALEALSETEPYFRAGSWSDRPWTVFAKPELATHISQILANDQPNIHLIDGIIGALTFGPAVRGLETVLHSVIVRSTLPDDARVRAVRAYVRQTHDLTALVEVYRCCATGQISDPDGEIRTQIYVHCHSQIPTPEFVALLTELWPEQNRSFLTHYYRLFDKLPSSILVDVLDGLASEQAARGSIHADDGLNPHHCNFGIRHFLWSSLLTLDKEGHITTERAARWLKLFGSRRSEDSDAWDDLWLRVNEGGKLFRHLFSTAVLPGDLANLWERFVHEIWSDRSPVPIDANAIEYLIRLAASLPEDAVATEVARCAANFLWGSDRSSELYELAIGLWSERLCLTECVASLHFCVVSDWRFEQSRRSKAHRIKEARNTQRLIKRVADGLDGIRQWTDFALLEVIGEEYFESASDQGNKKPSKAEALRALFGQSLADDLVEAMVDGIRGASLPTLATLAGWAVDGSTYRATYAALAAMEIAISMGRESEVSLENQLIVSILALSRWGASELTSDSGDGVASGWFWRFLRDRSDFVTEAVIEYFRPIAAAGNFLFDLSPLLYAKPEQFSELPAFSRRVLLDLRPTQYQDFRRAVFLVLKDGGDDIVATEAELRLTQSPADNETGFWISVGWLSAPAQFSERFEQVMRGASNDSAWGAILAVFPDHHDAPSRALTIPQAEWLAELVGARFGWAARPTGVISGVTNAWDGTQVAIRLINQISGDISDEALAALARLLSRPTLLAYRPHLLHEIAAQRSRRRDQTFSAPSLSSLRSAFRSTGITGAADAVAITLDELESLQAVYRGGDTTGWRKYWNTGRRGVVDSPKIEDHCRDVLLDDLRPRLRRYGLELNQATPASRGNEADASIQGREANTDLRVPIEAKMVHNAQLWTAPRDQLLNKYMIDPRSGGHGLYVVFWTGVGNTPRRLDGSPSPNSAEELRVVLNADRGHDERGRIEVFVLDVSEHRPPKRLVGDLKNEA